MAMSNEKKGTQILGKTIQIYITPKCAMRCGHCSSKDQVFPDMEPRLFQELLEDLKYIQEDISVELFGNDPLLHEDIHDFIQLLNESEMDYGLLTVGKSPRDNDVQNRFWEVVKSMDKERGSLVFSVDYTQEAAERIVYLGMNHPLFSEAYKALVFWRNSVPLKEMGIPVRVNIVISKNNIDGVIFIVERVVKLGFAVSFCFVQTRHPEFEDLLFGGLTPKMEDEFVQYLHRAGILDEKGVKKVVQNVREIVWKGEIRDSRNIFNTFRGSDEDEADLSSDWLRYTKNNILRIKEDMKNKNGEDLVIPGEEFIRNLGFPGNGCLDLLRQGIFSQLKVRSEGQAIWCCDLCDPITQEFLLSDLREEKNRRKFLEAMRLNPYIWACNFFNGGCFSPKEKLYGGCHFSVNYVNYSAANVGIR